MGVEAIRWGVLGTARINARLLPAIRECRSAELTAVASRDLARADAAAREAGAALAFGSYDELIACEAVEAVYIPLPNSLHGEWVRKAADAGKHVLCEKPLCPTAAEAEDLAGHCRSRGVTLMDGFMWPHHPRTRRIRELLDSGELGRVLRVAGAFSFLLEPLSPENIRLRPELGGGSLLDVGCYPVFGIRWAFGEEPVRVQAWARYEHGCDVEMAGVLWFADGRSASFDCGFTMPFRGWMEVTCERGVVNVPDMWLPREPARFHVAREREPAEPYDGGTECQIVSMLEEFAAAARAGREPSNPPAESVKTLRVLDALARSAREGVPAELA